MKMSQQYVQSELSRRGQVRKMLTPTGQVQQQTGDKKETVAQQV